MFAVALEPSERKLLFVLVRDALLRPGDDKVDTTKRNPKTVQALRSFGLLQPDEDSLVPVQRELEKRRLPLV